MWPAWVPVPLAKSHWCRCVPLSLPLPLPLPLLSLPCTPNLQTLPTAAGPSWPACPSNCHAKTLVPFASNPHRQCHLSLILQYDGKYYALKALSKAHVVQTGLQVGCAALLCCAVLCATVHAASQVVMPHASPAAAPPTVRILQQLVREGTLLAAYSVLPSSPHSHRSTSSVRSR